MKKHKKRKKSLRFFKNIWIEWRPPQTDEERAVYGLTHEGFSNVAKIFINTARCKTNKDKVMTLWHELFHVFCHFHEHKLSKDREEDMCRRLESIIWEVIR